MKAVKSFRMGLFHPIGWFTLAALLCALRSPGAPTIPVVKGVEFQPLAAQVERVFEAMDYVGSPVSGEVKAAFQAIQHQTNGEFAAEQLQKILDPLCLLMVEINPESRVKVGRGAAEPELVEQGWRQFLVKVHNEAGVTAPLKADSPNAQRLAGSPPGQLANRWLDLM